MTSRNDVTVCQRGRQPARDRGGAAPQDAQHHQRADRRSCRRRLVRPTQPTVTLPSAPPDRPSFPHVQRCCHPLSTESSFSSVRCVVVFRNESSTRRYRSNWCSGTSNSSWTRGRRCSQDAIHPPTPVGLPCPHVARWPRGWSAMCCRRRPRVHRGLCPVHRCPVRVARLAVRHRLLQGTLPRNQPSRPQGHCPARKQTRNHRCGDNRKMAAGFAHRI